ncbi:MAG: helix-turn-helix domain-containing protein [Muribaculaceae bacterium]|nr:helix-turn-helix domain-containing protein [Muribaculaceae bacterium]
MDHLLNFSDLAALKDYARAYGQHGDDYIVCSTSHLLDNYASTEPVRLAGLGLGLCLLREGEIKCEIDLKTYHVKAPAMLSVVSKSVFRNFGHGHGIFDCLFVSPRFIHDLNIDLSAINLHDMIDNPPRTVTDDLTQAEIEVFESYFRLLYRNAVDDNEVAFSKNIGRSVMQALFYQILQYNNSRSTKPSAAKDDGTQARQIAYVHEFMRLLQLHHKIQRSIQFYAERMYISPKYLSHIIKEATGKSASEWIAEFVVMEAKNMLRYSHKNIQQVAYELNFTTQSSFGKYFKHVTGMSPTEFQKT